MKVLAIDSSGLVASVALAEDSHVLIESRVYLIPTGVHHRAHQPVRTVQIVSQRLQSRHLHQRLSQRQTQTLGRCRTDPQPGKGTGAGSLSF